jgi:hypothetical protein
VRYCCSKNLALLLLFSSSLSTIALAHCFSTMTGELPISEAGLADHTLFEMYWALRTFRFELPPRILLPPKRHIATSNRVEARLG